MKLKPKKNIMKKFNVIILLVFISLGYSQQDISNKYSETITQEELKNLLEIYSSDEFEGRQTGKYGDELAANFLKGLLLKNDIQPADNTDNYFQKYQLNLPGEMYIKYSFLKL